MGRSGVNIEAAQAIAASVAQLELAVREVRPCVEQLGQLIDSMSTGLTQLRKSKPQHFDPESVAVFPDEFDRSMANLEKQVHGGIIQLQFYDQMVQHVKHLENFLTGVASELASDVDNRAIWEELRSRLRVSLTTRAQQELLDVVLPPTDVTYSNPKAAQDEHAARGTIELF